VPHAHTVYHQHKTTLRDRRERSKWKETPLAQISPNVQHWQDVRTHQTDTLPKQTPNTQFITFPLYKISVSLCPTSC
ncbi:hypothetical protein BDR03DRAFT_946823, partial [Suillus americanus]